MDCIIKAKMQDGALTYEVVVFTQPGTLLPSGLDNKNKLYTYEI